MNPVLPHNLLPIGDFYPQDSEGRVLNRCAADLIGDDWKPLIGAGIDALKSGWGDRLLGIYLRGSVPAGTAVKGVSDLDMVALLNWRSEERFIRWEMPAWAQSQAQTLQARFPVAAGIEMMAAHFDPEIPGHNPQIKMVLKTQGLCVWGKDVLDKLPDYRPGPEMMLYHRWYSQDLRDFRSLSDPQSKDARGFVKSLIRTCFELVMEKEGRFATDLYPCWAAVVRHRPEYAGALEDALQMFLEAEQGNNRLTARLDRMVDQVDGEVRKSLLSSGL